MQVEPYFSWLREFIVPAFLTLFGAGIAYVATVVRDERKAKRDKQAFLRAVGMEMDALGKQLDDPLLEVKASAERVSAGGVGPQFAAALRTSVFTSQVGKVRDVDDMLMVEVIHFYSDFGTLEQILESVNSLSADYSGADTFFTQKKDAVKPRLQSSLFELQRQFSAFSGRLKELRAKLPAPGSA